MNGNPFLTPFAALPDSLPIFPLTAAVVMPHAELPLNVFEPRYLNMIKDALASHRMIGMIQPNPDDENETAICRTGCAARITEYRETNDGRIELVLTGVCRFDAAQELSTIRGYRLVVPDWSRFSVDYENSLELNPNQQLRLLDAVQRYFAEEGYKSDMAALERMPVTRLVDSLITALPFDHRQKQMFLETIDPETRLAHLIELIDNSLDIANSATRH